MRPSRLPVLLAFTLPLLFAAYTAHAWEDYFITLRSSRNLVEGHGLVFNPGERVHTFTSPLGVLLPAFCTWLAGPTNEIVALWLFRLISAGCLAGAAWLVWRRTQTLGTSRFGQVVLFGLLLADAKLTDFAINGMETGLLVFFVLLLWSELEAPRGPRVGALAIAVGGLMWTRPDAFILGAALLLPHLFIRGDAGRLRAAWPSLWRGVLLGGLLYVPWFAWAWWYYGTPVPHTITAKSAYVPPVSLSSLLMLPWDTLLGRSQVIDLFMPSYWVFGGWPASIRHVAHALTGIAAFAWIVPRLPATARRVSLAVFLGMFYIGSIILFPWYVPPWSALAIVAVALTADALYRGYRRTGPTWVPMALRIGAALAVAVQIGIFAGTAVQMRTQQRVIEEDIRRDVGLWLRAHAEPGDSLFLEPLGYIGYYSQLKTYDFPGLSSPEVVAAVRGGARRYVDIIRQLQPTWLVLRAQEAAGAEFQQSHVLGEYERVRAWNALPALNAIALLPGRGWVENDARFAVYRRKTDAAPAVRPAAAGN